MIAVQVALAAKGIAGLISFELPEQLALAKGMFESVAREVVRPAAKLNDAAREVPTDILNALHQAGLIQASLMDDEQVQPKLLNCLLLEELGAADTSIAVLVGSALGYAAAIREYGSPDQVATLRRNYLGDNLRGGMILVQEPGFGADLNALRTAAVSVDGGYRLSGSKAFVPTAAGWEDMIVVARVGAGHGAFLLSKSTPGVAISPGNGTLGLRALEFAQVQFHDVFVPSQDRLGVEGGFDVQALISAARLGRCSILTGLARAVFEHITHYTKERVVHGAPLAQKQSVAFRLADMFINIPAMRWTAWKGAVALEKGRCAAREARLAQIYSTQHAFAFADEGVQLMGGHGYMEENPVERWFRDARTLTLLEGLVGI